MDDGEEREEAGRDHSGPPDETGPARWVHTQILECELWNAIAEDCSQPFDEDADYDGDDDPIILENEFEDEEELRGSLFRQLADLRPELGALLSEPQDRAQGES
jgi:hypothetical protein